MDWKNFPLDENLHSGVLSCQGCGASLSMRYALKALGKDVVVIIPACCWSIIDGAWPNHAVNAPLFHTAFETAAVVASGVKRGLNIQGKENTTVMAWAGDGGTFDIGLQAISGAAERNEDILYVCYDNEAYMNTGIQRSGATPWGAWTTTTPAKFPNDRPKKDIISILAAHKVPYIATATIGFPDDMIEKFKKAKTIKGFRFIHLLSPCPPGWKTASEKTIELTQLAVKSHAFNLMEIENYGKDLYLNYIPDEVVPIKDYLKPQGRFRHLKDEDIDLIQQQVDLYWKELNEKSKGIREYTRLTI